MRWVLPILTLALGVTLAGCEGHVRRGTTLYADGRYVEAAEVFERTEYRLTQFTPRERAEYGVYRGMTLLVLGDLAHARRWLTYAYEVEKVAPGALRSDRRALLDRGWFELGQRLRTELERTARDDGTALAARQPPSTAPAPPRNDAGNRPPGGARTLVPR
ncbi:MAG: hypothetical protein IPI67_20485 [Myxococcales bacterium]|nr:hypothetical protein [Myxococcales bacterium]